MTIMSAIRLFSLEPNENPRDDWFRFRDSRGGRGYWRRRRLKVSWLKRWRFWFVFGMCSVRILTGISWFSSVSQDKYRDRTCNEVTTASCYVISNSLFALHIDIRRDIVRDTDKKKQTDGGKKKKRFLCLRGYGLVAWWKSVDVSEEYLLAPCFMLVYCLACSSTLKIETVCSSETLVTHRTVPPLW
jgi:hypothetical protein